MNVCKNCFKAQTIPLWDGYTHGCEACNTRCIARSWPSIRKQWFEITLKKDGPDAESAMKKRVAEERARIKRLKSKE